MAVAIGLTPGDYASHSLRRSGATHLFLNGVPVETIRIIGDWRSDAIYKYLKPTPDSKLLLLKDKF